MVPILLAIGMVYAQKREFGQLANITVEVVERLARIFKCGWQEIVGTIDFSDQLPAGMGRRRVGGFAVFISHLQTFPR